MVRVTLSLALTGLLFSVACSRPANLPSPAQDANPALTADVKLAAPAWYPSGTTQSVLFNITRLDESRGIIASANGGCSASGPAEKTAPGTYRASITIPAHPEDGTCAIRLTSVADNAAGAVNLHYFADPEYWRRAAPAMYAFAHSKVWTFHSGDEMKIFKLLQASPSSGNKLAVLLVGDKDARAGMSVSPDNAVVGEFEGCVIEGKFTGKTVTMKPMMESDSCKGVTTVTLMVSD